MHSITLWRSAPSPNYVTNIDRVYPYSEVPFIGEYNLVKLPLTLNKLIDHVDYWGEGKIVTEDGTSGFANSYNINHAYQLVSKGEDRDKKIPNRIPVQTSSKCDTSSYIRDNSVLTVTVMDAPINESCAADIARMVNNDLGKVVVYGFDSKSKDIQNLIASLKSKGLYHYTNYKLPSELQGLTAFDDHLAFLNTNEIKNILYKLVTDGEYDAAVELTDVIDKKHETIVTYVVHKLLHSNSTVDRKLLSYAYKLWSSGSRDVVERYFPTTIKLIVGQQNVSIVNTGYLQALKLDVKTDEDGDRRAWGDNYDKTSKRVNWRFVPVWANNDLTFYLYNVDCEMYLKLGAVGDTMGDRQAWGTKDSEGNRQAYYVQPSIEKENLRFRIINSIYGQGLKLVTHKDSIGDRLLMGHNGDISKDEGRFIWSIASWSPDIIELKNQLCKLITDSKYDEAVTFTKDLDAAQIDGVVNNAVQNLLRLYPGRKNVMSYAYKLWSNGAQDIVQNNFPAPIKLILDQKNVTIVSTDFLQALKLDVNTDYDGDRLAWGDSYDKTSKRMSWQFVPVWFNNNVTFKLYNVDCKMYLKLAATGDDRGERQTWGTKNAEQEYYYLKPYLSKEVVVFRIFNLTYHETLKLDLNIDSYGDRLLIGHRGNIQKDEKRFRWTIESWSPQNFELKEQLCKLVTDRKYDAAVKLTKTFVNGSALVTEAVQTLLRSNSSNRTKLMTYAYKLWNCGAQDVQNNFPDPIKLILDHKNVTIVNIEYRQALKLDANKDGDGDRLAWGDSNDKTSMRVNWRFEPIWSNDEVTFRLQNVEHGMYLKLAVKGDDMGDKQVWGTTDSKNHSLDYYLEPSIEKGNVVFRIINRKYSQGLKLVSKTDSYGDRLLMGHNGDIHEDRERFKWTIALAPLLS